MEKVLVQLSRINYTSKLKIEITIDQLKTEILNAANQIKKGIMPANPFNNMKGSKLYSNLSNTYNGNVIKNGMKLLNDYAYIVEKGL